MIVPGSTSTRYHTCTHITGSYQFEHRARSTSRRSIRMHGTVLGYKIQITNTAFTAVYCLFRFRENVCENYKSILIRHMSYVIVTTHLIESLIGKSDRRHNKFRI